jgi:hypothetical protein
MLYTHFTKEEMDQIVEILNRHVIKHEIEINEDLIEEQNAKISRVRYERHGAGAGQLGRHFYSVKIEKVDFEKLPAEAKMSLEKFNILPEISDELFHAETEKMIPFVPVVKRTFWERIFSVLAIAGILFALLEWIDNYVTPIWPE